VPDIKINKDFRTYKEGLFAGLSLRQCICGLLAILCAIIVNVPLRPVIGKDLAGFLSFISAGPLAIAGWFTYNGMTLEKFAVVWIRHYFLAGYARVYKSRNFLCEALRDAQKELNAKTAQNSGTKSTTGRRK
jgi:hypothetical protein